MQELWVSQLGSVPYAEAFELQRTLRDRRAAGELPDLLLVLEHPPVYTRGKRTEPADLPMSEDWYRERGIEVEDTDRGGRVTYHGPGQLVAYPIMAVERVADFVHTMEAAIVTALGDEGVAASRGRCRSRASGWATPRSRRSACGSARASRCTDSR